MPLYEYQCDECEHRFEVIQKFSDDLVSICPKCEGRVRKLVSSPAIQFKGTGWYVTDYARKPSGEESEDKPKTEKKDKAAASTSKTKSSDSSAKKTTSDTSSKPNAAS
jgi:putative FmdB family regulatory protein